MAILDDCTEIGEIHVAAWRETYCGLVPDAVLASLSVSQRRSLWLQMLSERSGPSFTQVYVAPAQSRIAGFAACGPQRSEHLRAMNYDGEISAIYILRSSQGRGFGRKLFEAAITGLRGMQHTAFSLWVLRDNVQARGFYEHLGGKLIGDRKDIRDDCVLHEVAYGWRSQDCASFVK